MNNEDMKKKEEESVSLLDIMLVLAKRWKFIFFSTVIAAVLVLGYSFYTLKASQDAPLNYLINYYSPKVLIRLQQDESTASSLFSQGGLSALASLAGGKGSGNTSADLAMELLRGNTIIDQVVDEFDFVKRYEITEYPRTKSRRKVLESLQTNFDSDTGILSVKYTDTDPVFATEILSRLIELLEVRFKSLTMEKILNKKQFLEERLDQVTKELKIAQEELIEFQIEHGIVDVINPSTDSTEMITPEIVFSQYLSRSERHEITTNYVNLERDRRILEGIYELLMEQYEAAKIEEMDDTKIFQIIESPEVPEVKAGPSRAKISMIFTVAVFFLMVFIAFLSEYFEKIRKYPEEAEKLKQIKKSLFQINKKKRVD